MVQQMATIAELTVQIDANNRGLNTALKKSESRVQKFARKARKAIGNAFKVGIAAAAVSVAALGAALAKASDRIDKLAKTSAKLGVAAEELQKLQLQANLSGVSTETLNMALQRMVRRVAEAAMGTGEAVKALQELGINAKELNKLSPDKQFQMLAKAMSGVANQSDKVRLAMKLFDSEGVALVNTLGSDLEGVSKKFDALGLGITKSQAAAVEAMNDSRTILGALFDDITNKVLVELAPSFQAITDGIIEWVKEMGGAGVVAKKVADIVKTSFTAVKSIIEFFGPAFGVLKLSLKGLGMIADFVFKNWAGWLKTLRGLITDLIEKVVELAQKLNSIRKKATTAALDALPGLQHDPNAPDNQNAPAAMAARANRARQQQQNVTVQIIADKEGLVNAVITDEEYRRSIDAIAAKVMKDTARATRR